MKTRFIQLSLIFSMVCVAACNSNTNKNQPAEGTATNPLTEKDNTPPADEKKGVGKFTTVELTHPLDAKMVSAGESIYGLKCGSCHKLTDEKLVGPGWKGVTSRRAPEWIMNFITNTEEMLEKNVTAKSLYEICLVKMPNQQLTDNDARSVLEFMRKNDGDK